MIIIGLILLIAAVAIGVAGVVNNTGTAHELQDDFTVFGGPRDRVHRNALPGGTGRRRRGACWDSRCCSPVRGGPRARPVTPATSWSAGTPRRCRPVMRLSRPPPAPRPPAQRRRSNRNTRGACAIRSVAIPGRGPHAPRTDRGTPVAWGTM